VVKKGFFLSGKTSKQQRSPKVSVINVKLSKRWGEDTVVIPAPIEVDEYMRYVPKGKKTTIS
jgi:hypothetical protein